MLTDDISNLIDDISNLTDDISTHFYVEVLGFETNICHNFT